MADDPTLICKFRLWALRGENIPRLALHVHGDAEAFALAGKFAESVEVLAEDALAGPTLDLEELDAAFRRIGIELGLAGSAGEARCIFDPLQTVIDASLHRRAASLHLAQ